MQKLLTWRTDSPGEQQKSTLWNPMISERDYMVETRGKDKSVMWLEVQPYGTPKRQPEGPAQVPSKV